MSLNSVVYGSVKVSDLLLVAAVLIFSFLLAKIISKYLRRGLKEKVREEDLDVIVKVVYYSIISIAIISVLPILGIRLSGLLVAGSIAGIVIGFASQNIIGNLVSGVFLMIERPIKIGNQINIEGISGFVEDINVLSTIIRTYDGLYVRMPNQKVFSSNITNFVGNVARRFEYNVGIRYSDDADKAIEIIKNLIEEHPLTLKNPDPMVFVDSLGDNAVIIIVRIWAPIRVWYRLKMEMLWKIKKALEEKGIEIAFPQRTVWFANELKKREIGVPENSDKERAT
jgi:small-conductance mechanosensitive channel